MKILKLKYADQQYNLEFDSIEFLPDLNLFVGISGAGKTQILKAILNLKELANGSSLNGVIWDVSFLAKDQSIYRWQGKFQTKENPLILIEGEDDEDKCQIVEEFLFRNDQKIIERQKNIIIFNDQALPKLSPFQSSIDLLSQEEDISLVKSELQRIVISDTVTYDQGPWRVPIKILQKYEGITLSEMRETNLPLMVKLTLTYKYLKDDFAKLKQVFTEIFTQIEDIKIERLFDDDLPVPLTQLKDIMVIKIKEKNIDNWVIENNISLGMLKTLLYISELYLSSPSSVILIDEFENSLGVNCLDSVTDLILENTDHQFIITSHHPYIINNISPANWKIVMRKGNLITVKNPEYYHISKSRKNAFIDLINLFEEQENDDEDN